MYVRHFRTEIGTCLWIGPAKNAETVPTSITFAIYALKTASGIASLVLTTSRRSSNAKAAKQDITDSRDITPMKLVTVCMVELQIVNPMREVADIHEMRAGQADKKALNSCDLIRHHQDNVLG